MTKLNDPELERLREELLAVALPGQQGAALWPLIAASAAAVRTYLARRYPDDVANFDAVSREPAWVMIDPSPRRPIMGILDGMAEDKRMASLVQQNAAKLASARLAMATVLSSIDTYSARRIGDDDATPESSLSRVRLLLDRFQQVADEFRENRANKPTIALNDEYDVQFLLGGLLRIFFDDVEPESYAPGLAGGPARMDFLLPKENTAIEVKFATATLRSKQLRDQLIIDIDRYRQHPRCRHLVCFVYDRDGTVENPRGFESDLTESRDGITVATFVRPLR